MNSHYFLSIVGLIKRPLLTTVSLPMASSLQELSNERGEIIKKLKDTEAKAEFPAEKNTELARQLAVIEEKAMILEKDKDDIRKR